MALTVILSKCMNSLLLQLFLFFILALNSYAQNTASKECSWDRSQYFKCGDECVEKANCSDCDNCKDVLNSCEKYCLTEQNCDWYQVRLKEGSDIKLDLQKPRRCRRLMPIVKPQEGIVYQ